MVVIAMLLWAVVLTGCTFGADSRFAGKTGRNPQAVKSINADPIHVEQTPPSDDDNAQGYPPDVAYPEVPIEVTATPRPPTEFSLTSEMRSAVNDAEVWVVSSNKAWRIRLDAERGYPQTVWTMPNRAGNRTFVSEIGLLVGKTWSTTQVGGVYRVSDDVANEAQFLFKPDDIANESRLCVTSFRVDGQAFIGAAYRDTSNRRSFFRIPIDKSKTTRVDASLVEFGHYDVTSSQHTSYSCYVDQSRLYFWVGGYRGSGGDFWGVNLRSLEALPLTAVPNAGHTNDAIEISQTQNLSYALAGDGRGNVSTLRGAYTSAHEPIADMLLVSYNSGVIHALKGDCLYAKAACASTDFHSFDISAVTSLGPLSSLNDGRVLGLQRTSGNVFLLSFKDVANPVLGLDVVKIAALGADPYMYTDFTGATLYPAEVESTVLLRTSPVFRPGVPITDLHLQWNSQSGNVETWRGLRLKIRCYAQAAVGRPDWQEVATVADAGTAFSVAFSQCRGVFDAVDIHIEGDSVSNIFSRTAEIVIQGKQEG